VAAAAWSSVRTQGTAGVPRLVWGVPSPPGACRQKAAAEGITTLMSSLLLLTELWPTGKGQCEAKLVLSGSGSGQGLRAKL